MRKKITFEERVRSKYALHVAMESVGVNSTNAFSSYLNKARMSNSKNQYLSYTKERVVPASETYLKRRQRKVDMEIREIENNIAREQSDVSNFERIFDDEKYWLSLISPVRFHRISKGKGSSKAPSRMKTLADDVTGNTMFEDKNIWYFLKPFAGERAYFAYKFGPSKLTIVKI